MQRPSLVNMLSLRNRELSAVDESSLLTLLIQSSGKPQKRGPKERKSWWGEESCEKLMSRRAMTLPRMGSQELWLSAQVQLKGKPAKTPAWMGKSPLRPTIGKGAIASL